MNNLGTMICVTTPTVEGHRATRVIGIVAGETILGANIFRDFLAAVRIVGGRSGAYETVLRDARRSALEEMTREARTLGANAVVAVDLDYETVGNGMLMVTASGTAVVIEPA
jgi:uncharacterized protein YbjQ (UPF0145 family)